MPDHDLVVLRTYLNGLDAEIDCGRLEAAGLPAMVRSDDCGGMRPHLWLRGVELVVRAEDRDAAAALLEPGPDEGDAD